MDRSANPISQNILKDIINYSHISHSNVRNGKGTTLATYDRHQDVMSQFSKINKKTSLGNIGKNEHHKLVLDNHTPSNPASLRSSDFLHDNRSIEMIQSEIISQEPQMFEQPKVDRSSRKNSFGNSVSKTQLSSLEKEKSELTAKFDELQSIEDGIVHEYSEMIQEW